MKELTPGKGREKKTKVPCRWFGKKTGILNRKKKGDIRRAPAPVKGQTPRGRRKTRGPDRKIKKGGRIELAIL